MQTGPRFLEVARDLSATIHDRYWKPSLGRYAAYIREDGQVAKRPAYAWDLGVQLSALAAGMRFVKGCVGLFDEAQSSLDAYGSNYKGVFGYAVLPNQRKPDRYYDDNEWIALAQLDAYDATKNPKYLASAERTFRFVESGLSRDLDGGIFWRERQKKTKNTCSNAPAILAAARLFKATRDERYLHLALELHGWVERLKDPGDSLMFDSVGLDGRIVRTKWTYNTALMIQGDVALYGITHESRYRDEAEAMGASAIKHWVDSSTGAIHDEGPFAHHLAEAFFALSSLDRSHRWAEVAERAIEFAYLHAGRGGLFGLRWDRYEVRDHRLLLLYQASMDRALWLAATRQLGSP